MDEHENGISLLILIMGMDEYGIFTELYHYIYIYLFFAIFYHILCTPGLKEDYIILWMDKILQLVTVGHHEARFTNPTGPTWGIPVFQPFKCGVAVFGRCDLSGPMAEICRNESGK
jgi:hypothetical protein